MMEIQLKPADYKSDVEPTWCSGCGDFGVVAALTRAYAELGLRPENIVSVSGIGVLQGFLSLSRTTQCTLYTEELFL